ncbi:hypothetical protein ANCDUO_01359 [Ancylostoma duodenale]|uniref:Uncharacterized protein n=1 Tax=Ancylostoma duodenale TaxID=51022 RepID=A0A0C2HFE0_9BILA|nr:hypothetical protein ANCDUO_01359 [Ancylostoma duodenale]
MSRRERKRRGRWETYNSEFNSEEGFSNSSVDKQVEKEAAAPVPKAASHNLNGENVAVITDEFGGKDYRSDMPLKACRASFAAILRRRTSSDSMCNTGCTLIITGMCRHRPARLSFSVL